MLGIEIPVISSKDIMILKENGIEISPFGTLRDSPCVLCGTRKFANEVLALLGR